MFQIDYDPIKRYWDEKNKSLSEEQLRLKKEMYEKDGNLQVLKRTRREKKDGDIFICSLNGKVYYYGRILQAKIEGNQDDWFNQCLLVIIYREKTAEKNLKNFRGDYNNLLIVPCAITSQYWSMGMFETIGNIPLTEEEQNLDYGFWTDEGVGTIKGNKSVMLVPPRAFTKVDGTLLDHLPKHIGYGITTTIGVYHKIAVEAIIDPTLLTM